MVICQANVREFWTNSYVATLSCPGIRQWFSICYFYITDCYEILKEVQTNLLNCLLWKKKTEQEYFFLLKRKYMQETRG